MKALPISIDEAPVVDFVRTEASGCHIAAGSAR